MNYHSDKYRARAIHGGHCMPITTDDLETLKALIDERNARVMSRGYKAESWIITHKVHDVWYDEDGIFSKSQETEQSVEIYPKE